MAQIQRLDRGTTMVIRQGPTGSYYNHPCCEHGRHISCYVPAEQVAELKAAMADCQQLLQQNVQLMVEKTRAQRQAGSKQTTPRPTSSRPKTGKSNT